MKKTYMKIINLIHKFINWIHIENRSVKKNEKWNQYKMEKSVKVSWLVQMEWNNKLDTHHQLVKNKKEYNQKKASKINSSVQVSWLVQMEWLALPSLVFHFYRRQCFLVLVHLSRVSWKKLASLRCVPLRQLIQLAKKVWYFFRPVLFSYTDTIPIIILRLSFFGRDNTMSVVIRVFQHRLESLSMTVDGSSSKTIWRFWISRREK